MHVTTSPPARGYSVGTVFGEETWITSHFSVAEGENSFMSAFWAIQVTRVKEEANVQVQYMGTSKFGAFVRVPYAVNHVDANIGGFLKFSEADKGECKGKSKKGNGEDGDGDGGMGGGMGGRLRWGRRREQAQGRRRAC